MKKKTSNVIIFIFEITEAPFLDKQEKIDVQKENEKKKINMGPHMEHAQKNYYLIVKREMENQNLHQLQVGNQYHLKIEE
jgi:hypothetical protein